MTFVPSVSTRCGCLQCNNAKAPGRKGFDHGELTGQTTPDGRPVRWRLPRRAGSIVRNNNSASQTLALAMRLLEHGVLHYHVSKEMGSTSHAENPSFALAKGQGRYCLFSGLLDR